VAEEAQRVPHRRDALRDGPTAAASADLFRIVGQFSSDARNRAGIDFEESLSQAFENHNQGWRQARRRLLDEMREDVAADRLPVDWAAMD
jgi:hypothetical protein